MWNSTNQESTIDRHQEIDNQQSKIDKSLYFFISWMVSGERSSKPINVSAGMSAASPRIAAPAPPPMIAPTAAPVPPPAMAPTAAPAPAPIPIFAASFFLLLPASLLTGVVTSSTFRP